MIFAVFIPLLFPSSVHFQNGDRPPSWILKFSQFLSIKLSRLFQLRHAKLGEDRTIRSHVIEYFQFSKWRQSAILDFQIFAVFVKISNYSLFLDYVDMQNLTKV